MKIGILRLPTLQLCVSLDRPHGVDGAFDETDFLEGAAPKLVSSIFETGLVTRVTGFPNHNNLAIVLNGKHYDEGALKVLELSGDNDVIANAIASVLEPESPMRRVSPLSLLSPIGDKRLSPND